MVRVKARAKLNLYLRVLGKRLDGYHEIESVMQSINLADDLVLTLGGTVGVSYRWDEGLAGPLPSDDDLVTRAIQRFKEATGEALLVGAQVTKRIPMGAGLGGGSADAAGTLAGLNYLLGHPFDDDSIEGLAQDIGSDVPFMLKGGTAFVSGRGEKVTKIESPASLWWVLGVPAFSLSTRDVYDASDELFLPDPGSRTIDQALAGGKVAEIAISLRNDLEPAAAAIVPDTSRLIESMRVSGALESVMSGSGSTVAGLCLNRSHAEEVAANARLSFPRVEIVKSAETGIDLLGG